MFANRIRELRKERRESLRNVAEATGIDHSQLSKIERGEQGCTDANKLTLARHFDVPVYDLFFVS
ncbi:MAG: helix-turn-helix domain-containing protein, partial [Dehalococcoidia bacterium]